MTEQNKQSDTPAPAHEPVAFIEAHILETLQAGGSGVFPMTANRGPSHRPQCTVALYVNALSLPPEPQKRPTNLADPYFRMVMFFDQDSTAGSFLAEDGEGGFVGAVSRMARQIDRLAEELQSAASLLETLAESLPEDDVNGVMMRVMAQRNRAALVAEVQA